MNDTREAFCALASEMGTMELRPDSHGWVELRMPGDMPVYIQVVEDDYIEIIVRLESFDRTAPTGALSGALAWNFAHAPARLALEADGAGLLCRRLDVRTLSAAELCLAIGELARTAHRLDQEGLPSMPRMLRPAAGVLNDAAEIFTL